MADGVTGPETYMRQWCEYHAPIDAKKPVCEQLQVTFDPARRTLMHFVASHALSFFTPVAAPELSTAPGGHGDVTGDVTSALQSDETSLNLPDVVYILPPECVGKQRRKQTAV
ncbi:hypothetical protein LSAT2_006098, partial [Lamellibrachia satsuma]